MKCTLSVFICSLQKLDLRENEIESIPREIEDLKKLNVCLFGHNKLNAIPGHFFKLSKKIFYFYYYYFLI